MDDRDHPVLQMHGVGTEIWANTNPDEYVRTLRANWYGTDPKTDDSDKPEDS